MTSHLQRSCSQCIKTGTAGLGNSDLLPQHLCTCCSFGLERFSHKWPYICPHLLQFLLQPPSSARCSFCGSFFHLKFHFSHCWSCSHMTPRKQPFGDYLFTSLAPTIFPGPGTQQMLNTCFLRNSDTHVASTDFVSDIP